MSSLSLSCIGLVFPNVRLQRNVGCRLQKNPCMQTVEVILLFISCFPQIYFEILNYLNAIIGAIIKRGIRNNMAAAGLTASIDV